MADIELMRCPKCGGEMKIRLWEDGYQGQYFEAVCSECGLRSKADTLERIVLEWSDCNPVPKPKTYADDFFEKHPNAPKRANGMPMAFRCQVYGCSCGKHEANMINGCEMCWNEPYKEKETNG